MQRHTLDFEYPGVKEMLSAHCEMEEPRSDKTNLYSLMYGLALCAKQGRALFGHVRLHHAQTAADLGQGQPQASAILGQSNVWVGPNGPCFAHRPLSLAAT